MNFVLTLALILTFSPWRRKSCWALLAPRLTVRQIQPRKFSKRRQTIHLLLGEKAGMREVVNQRRMGRTPHSAIRIPHLNGSFPEFILGWTTEAEFEGNVQGMEIS